MTEFDVLDRNLNFSDHYPVTVKCDINLLLNCNKSKQCDSASVMHTTQFRWDHADLESDGSIDSDVVANKFADHFHMAYSCNNINHAAELYSEYCTMRRNYQGLMLTVNLDVELVSRVIYNLKRGKAADLDSLTAEHLLYSHPVTTLFVSQIVQFDLTL